MDASDASISMKETQRMWNIYFDYQYDESTLKMQFSPILAL